MRKLSIVNQQSLNLDSVELREKFKDAKKCFLEVPNMIDNKVAQLDAIKEFLYEVCEIFKVYCTEIIEASKDKDDSSKESLLDSIDDDNSQDVESSVGDEE